MNLLDRVFRSRQGRLAPDQSLERRATERYKVMEPVDIHLAGRSFRGTLVDLSQGGACIAARYSRDVGDVVGLNLVVEGIALTLPLRVVWVRFEEARFVMGGAFVEPTQRECEHLQRFLDVYAVSQGRLAQRMHIA